MLARTSVTPVTVRSAMRRWPAAAMTPRSEAQGDDDEEAGAHQDQRVADLVQDHGRDRVAQRQRAAEIALEEVAEPDAVLDEQRPIEAEGGAQGLDPLLGGGEAQDRARHVAGHQLDRREHDEAHTQQHRQGVKKAAKEELEHGAGPGVAYSL